MLSGTAEYALRAVLYLARQFPGRLVHVSDVAAALGIPPNYLAKILRELARSGVLASVRGRRGGFQLAVAPEQLSLLEVVGRFDDFGARGACLLGRTECGGNDPCSAHARWQSLADQIGTFFRDTTVADLLRGTPVPA